MDFLKMEPAKIYFIDCDYYNIIARFKEDAFARHFFYSRLDSRAGYNSGGNIVQDRVVNIREATDSEKHNLFINETANKTL